MAIRNLKPLMIALCLIAACMPASATTKGLNQIVTPDIQPAGVLSVSFQGQNSALGSSRQLQLELGVTRRFEVALFRGPSPGATVIGAEWGLVTRKPFLLSAGVVGVENHAKPQPFLEGGYYHDKWILIAGLQRQDSRSRGILGAAYQAAPRLQIATDYISGPANFAALGVTLAMTPKLSLNPAVYFSNSSPHRAYGYGVLSWNVKAW